MFDSIILSRFLGISLGTKTLLLNNSNKMLHFPLKWNFRRKIGKTEVCVHPERDVRSSWVEGEVQKLRARPSLIQPSGLGWVTVLLNLSFLSYKSEMERPPFRVSVRQMRPCVAALSPCSGMPPCPRAALALGQSGPPTPPLTHTTTHPRTLTSVNTGPVVP